MSIEIEIEETLLSDPIWVSLRESKILNGITTRPKDFLYVKIYFYAQALLLAQDTDGARECLALLDDDFDEFFEINKKMFMEINSLIK